MTRYIIIEDEKFAFDELQRMLLILRSDYELAGWAQSVEEAVSLIRNNRADLIITDIRLADGLCFEAFEQCMTDTPVIFTTAYDEFALKAFKMNSIDYLLKPVDEELLSGALDKFERNQLTRIASEAYARLEKSCMSNALKSRFLIQSGDTFRYIETSEIALFYSEDKVVFLHTFSGKRHIINYTLEQLESVLDSQQFYRLSRNCIANIRAVKKVSRFFAGRLHVTLSPECPQKVMVSRSRAAGFLKWLDGGC